MHWRLPLYQDTALLLIRFGLAAVFIVHGLLKWQDLSGTAAFFSGLGLPNYFVYVVAATEFIGGLLVLFGWLARFSALALSVVMIFAIVLVKGRLGFVGGYEFDLALMLMALAIVLAGPGKYKLRFINGNNNQIV